MKKVRKKKRSALAVFFAALGTLILVGVVTFILFCVYFYNWVTTDVKSQDTLVLEDYHLNQTSIILAENKATGEWEELQRLYASEDREWVDFENIPNNLVFACVSIEDKRFFDHDGVDWFRTSHACASMFIGRSAFGGSTITQQLVKNLTGDDDVTVHRKLTEIYRSLKLEEDYEKSDILEMYFNTIYLGEGKYGVQSAARHYFGKEVSELTLAECASLIGITNNPSLYDPYVYPENNLKRERIILQQMFEQGYISERQMNDARNQEIVFTSTTKGQDSTTEYGIYSYFVDEVVREVISDLQDTYGLSYEEANHMLTSGGYQIYSTVDTEIQSALESYFSDEANLPATKSAQQLQSAMMVIDNRSGDFVGIIGGTGKKEGSLIWDRATQSTLEPGSVLKPITVYATALEKGLITPISTMDDVPSRFTDTACWPPNTDGVYRGLVDMKTAVAQSLNTISVSLVDELTARECYQFARDNLHISTFVQNRDNLTDLTSWGMGMGSLVYGCRLEEITEAYAAFANDGVYRTGRTYTKITDEDGNVVLYNEQKENRAMSSKNAYYMTEMLEETVASGTGKGAALKNMAVAGKTGTTDDDFDSWFAGYTPCYSAVCWAGYDTPESIETMDGSDHIAVTIWHDVMQTIHNGLGYEDFDKPSNLVACSFCRDSGKLCTDACHADPRGDREITAYVCLEDAPAESCDCHVMVTLCGQSGLRATSYCRQKAYYSLTQIGLLSVTRKFLKEGIIVQDEQYNFVTNQPEGYYKAASPSATRYDQDCPIHTETVKPKTLDELIEEEVEKQSEENDE